MIDTSGFLKSSPKISNLQMGEISGAKSWTEELASLVEDTGIIYSDDTLLTNPPYELKKRSSEFISTDDKSSELVEQESFKDQIKGFAKAWGEIAIELGRGCRDVVQQTVLTEDSVIVQKWNWGFEKVSRKLRFLNEYLPEDRDPVLAWPVIFFVFILAISALSVNTKSESSVPLAKKVQIHQPSAVRVLLPDGRHMAYHEQGVPAKRARFSLISTHNFLSSRFAGIPGVDVSLLEEFGIRLVTYDLPGFGESDPHPNRTLHSSAMDILNLAEAVEINDKFWVLGYSSGAMHTWAALKYIPSRIAGAAMFAPMVNPYESGLTKEEKSGTWGKWTRRRRLMYYIARRFPKFLSSFYRRTFLSGKHGPIEKWLSLSLSNRDKALTENPVFEEFWHRDVEESIRQGSMKPFIEEAVLQVSNWQFSLTDLQVQRKCPAKGFFHWLKLYYDEEECELVGFLGPVHIWQGMDDQVVPPPMTEYVARVLPSVTVHKLPEEGHFSYFFFCNECHRKILSTLFGNPKGPLEIPEQTQAEGHVEEAPSLPAFTE